VNKISLFYLGSFFFLPLYNFTIGTLIRENFKNIFFVEEDAAQRRIFQKNLEAVGLQLEEEPKYVSFRFLITKQFHQLDINTEVSKHH
jgi:hypothetical protein